MDNLRYIIRSSREVSKAFKKLGLNDFSDAAEYVRNLPYRRISNHSNPLHVLHESCGTCSSKHHLLALLAQENSWEDIQLVLGIYKMNPSNTSGIARVFPRDMGYIPEAHCYFISKGIRLDFTRCGSQPLKGEDILKEMPLSPEEMVNKQSLHQEFLKGWCEKRGLDPSWIWEEREKCIAEISRVG